MSPSVEVAVLDQAGNLVTDQEFDIKLELLDDRDRVRADGTDRTSGGVATFTYKSPGEVSIDCVPPPTGYRRSKATDSRSKTTEPRRPRLRSAVVVCLTLLALQACGGRLGTSKCRRALRHPIVDGDAQVDTVGRPLPDSLVVKVTDPEGREVEGVEVVFVAPAGSTLAPNDTVFTGADGLAAIQYTLPTASGQQTIEARATPVIPSSSLTATFSAVAEPEQAMTL